MICNNTTRVCATRSGFTLAEILVVLVILAIATAVVVLRVSNMGDLQVASAARGALANMQFAQNEAIVTQREVTVAFDVINGLYELRYADGTVLTHPVDKNPFRVRFATTTGVEKVSILAADFNSGTTVTFDSLGSPSSDGEVTLIANGHRQRITVAPVTGRMSVAVVDP